MKEINLTQGYVALVDDDDYEWLSQWNWFASVQKHTVYALRRIKYENGKECLLSMHREILGLTDPKVLGEHADGNGLNNQRENLRPCNNSQNQMNKGSRPGSSSRFKGVSWHKLFGKWSAIIFINGRNKWIGCFKNEEDAARAYNQFAKKHHDGEFTRFNDVYPMFPDGVNHT